MSDRKQVLTILCNQITEADEVCRSSEISVNFIIIIVFLQTYTGSYFCYILPVVIFVIFQHLFLVLLCYILDVYIYIYDKCTRDKIPINTCVPVSRFNPTTSICQCRYQVRLSRIPIVIPVYVCLLSMIYVCFGVHWLVGDV